jgi:hypothetical protein
VISPNHPSGSATCDRQGEDDWSPDIRQASIRTISSTASPGAGVGAFMVAGSLMRINGNQGHRKRVVVNLRPVRRHSPPSSWHQAHR